MLKMEKPTLLLILITASLFINKGAAHDHSIDIKSDIGYTCLVYKNNHPACTGTLVSKMWVVTSCLCVKDIPNNHISIRIGDPSRKGKEKHIFYPVNMAKVHPECIGPNNTYFPEHDIALLMLTEPFLDSKFVYIAKIPHQIQYWTPDSVIPLDVATYTDMADKAQSLKQAVWHGQAKLLHPLICAIKIREKNFKFGKTTCATYHHKKGLHNCMLDIGAPMTFDYVLVGILVYKKGCGMEKGLASYVNVPMHSEWIRYVTQKYTSWINL